MGYRWASPKHLPSLFPKEERDRGQVRVKAGTDRGTVLRVLHRSESVSRGVPKAPGFPGAHRVKSGDRSGGALGPHPAPALSPQRGRPAPQAPDVDAAAAAAAATTAAATTAAAARESLSAEPICRRRGAARGGRAGRAAGWSVSASGHRAQESPCPQGRAPGRPAPRSACG
jgi:hypothetical protein